MRYYLCIWHCIICRRGFRGTGVGSSNRGCGGEAPHESSNNMPDWKLRCARYHPRTPPCVSPSMNRRWSARKITRIGAIIITAAALVSPQSRENRVVNW